MPSAILKRKLRKTGMSSSFINTSLMPTWWDEECEADKGCVQMLCARLASILGQDYKNIKNLIENPDNDITLEGNNVALKTNSSSEEKATPTVVICQKMATVLASVFEDELSAFSPPLYNKKKEIENLAKDIRYDILKEVAYVDFDSLLDYCWQKGIIVAHFRGLPKAKIDGAAIPHKNNPVIILGSNKKGAWSTFHLAHELGHIMLGHQKTSFCGTISVEDTMDIEQEANRFALCLLMGENVDIPEIRLTGSLVENRDNFVSWGRFHKVAPEVLILFVFNRYYKDKFSLVSKIISQEIDPHIITNAKLSSWIEKIDLAGEEEEFIESVLTYDGK